MKNINKALFELQGKLRGVQRDSSNPHFKNRYASLEQVTDTIRPHMQELGLFFMQMPGSVNEGSIEVKTVITHAESGEAYDFTMHVPLAKRDPQGAGSALTYGQRYSLMAVLGLPPTDDDAETAIDRNSERPDPQNEHADNLWRELTAITTMRGLKVFWDDHQGDIKMLGPNYLKKFSAEKDRLKNLFEAQSASTLNAG